MRIFKFKKTIKSKKVFNNNDIFIRKKNEINDIYHNINLDDNDTKELGIKFEVLENKKSNHIEPINKKDEKKIIKIEKNEIVKNKVSQNDKVSQKEKDEKEVKKEKIEKIVITKKEKTPIITPIKKDENKEITKEKSIDKNINKDIISKKKSIKKDDKPIVVLDEKPMKKKVKKVTSTKKEINVGKKKKYVEHLKKTMDEDFLVFKDILWELKEIRKEYEDTLKEKDLEKQKEKLEFIYKKIENFKKKYKDILNNEKFKYLKYDFDFNEKEYNFKYFSLYKPDDDTLKKIEIISKNLDILEKNFEIVKNENEERLDFVRTENKKIPLLAKEKDIINDVNYLTKAIISDQKKVIDGLKNKIGKVSTETFTKSRMILDYKKLLIGPAILSGIGNKMSRVGVSPLGKMAGIVGFSYAFSNFYNAVTWKDYNVTKVYFHDYNDVLNNSISSINGAYDMIDSSKYKIKDLLNILNDSYKKTDNDEIKKLINSLNIISKELDERKKELDKMRISFEEAKVKNDKGKILERKMKSEN